MPMEVPLRSGAKVIVAVKTERSRSLVSFQSMLAFKFSSFKLVQLENLA